ncbi:hypothetical protein B0H67DRAFT_598084 [Lasiosphaeris hirsuta]|uniref:Uncharacterized protein n=1 Tax=Lasiosphaeris hirsuta TaxID=260670 RepID=A0AA40E490_9PEZI|nr:hypothetical protein B0H67DRAFT_598084 [Lasiosphaeris hirsuta]
MIATVPPRKKWYQIEWFQEQDTPRERRLINKLDLLIVPYAFLTYWVKYIDQSNLNNAYVAGLKEDLGFKGNELVQLQTFYIVGAVTGQIPFLFLFTYVPMYLLIPFLDVAWGIFTLLQYRVTGFAELATYHFLIGRRGGVFYVGLTLGTLTTGLIQAGTSSRLDGLLNDKDIQAAKSRLEHNGHAVQGKFTFNTVKYLFTSWHFWAIILFDLKSLNRYTPARINELGAISPAIGIFYTVGICFTSDLFSFMMAYSAVSMSTSPTERSFVLTPLLVFKTVEVPRFRKGYAFVLGNAICLIITAHLLRLYLKKKGAKHSDSESGSVSGEDHGRTKSTDTKTIQVSEKSETN